MILADGSAKPFHGKGTFELEVEGKRALQEVWIADIELEGILGMDFVRRCGCQIIAALGGQLELFIPELTRGSGAGAKPAEEKELRNYQCLRVVVEETVLVPANSEMIAAAKVLDKCDGGLAILEPTLPTRRELLAVVDGIRHFHHYLYGRKFTVRTDHGALQWLMSFKDLEGQMAQWLEILGKYEYEVVYRPEAKHGNADASSRQPSSRGECGSCDRIEARHKSNDDLFCGAVTRNGRQERNLGAGSSQEAELWMDGIVREELQTK